MKRIAWFCLIVNALAIPMIFAMAWLVGAGLRSWPIVFGVSAFALLCALGAGFSISILRSKSKGTRATLMICAVCSVFSTSILLAGGFWLSLAAR